MKKSIEEKRMEFLDMQEHPENYSEEQLSSMLADPEMQEDIETFEMLRRMGESQKAKETVMRKGVARRFILRPRSMRAMAAAFAGCLLVAGVAYAAIRFVKEREPMPIMAVEGDEETAKGNVSPKEDNAPKTIATSDSIQRFDDEELETVVNAIADHYGMEARFGSEASRHIRIFLIWNRNDSLQSVVNILNGYDRIDITTDEKTLTVR